MLKFKTILKRFEKMGEKTGWTYIDIPQKLATKLNPGVKTSYRVKGRIDDHEFEYQSMMPMGGGDFIIPIKADIRKAIKKRKGDEVTMIMELDPRPVKLDDDFIQCLYDDPDAKEFFFTLNAGHRNYFSKWIESAKTETTKAKRIAQAVIALGKKHGFPEMLKANKKLV